jgi:hypothetical protein
MSCPPNSIPNVEDGTCTCLPNYMQSNGVCVPFDYNAIIPTAAGTPANTQPPRWQQYVNQFGPLVLLGLGKWWEQKNAGSTDAKPDGTPVNPSVPPPPAPPKDGGIPIWAYIGGGLLLVLIIILIVRKK